MAGRIIAESNGNEQTVLAASLTLMYVVMAVDTAIVFASLWIVARPKAGLRVGVADRAIGITWSFVALGIALAINVAYHALLLWYLDVPEWLVINPLQDADVWLIAAICVQPAIVEELFYRYLVLDTLRAVMRVNTAVWVSRLMFAVAHIGVPLSMPALMVVGVALGYARVWSGTLWLPMILHGVHNAVVLYVEQTV